MKKKVGALLGGVILAVVGFGITATPASAEDVCAPEVNQPPVVVARLCVTVTP